MEGESVNKDKELGAGAAAGDSACPLVPTDAASHAEREYLECPCCGDDGAGANEHGEFYDGQRLICGCPGWVTCDEDGAAWINNGDQQCKKCETGNQAARLRSDRHPSEAQK